MTNYTNNPNWPEELDHQMGVHRTELEQITRVIEDKIMTLEKNGITNGLKALDSWLEENWGFENISQYNISHRLEKRGQIIHNYLTTNFDPNPFRWQILSGYRNSSDVNYNYKDMALYYKSKGTDFIVVGYARTLSTFHCEGDWTWFSRAESCYKFDDNIIKFDVHMLVRIRHFGPCQNYC